jgi:hypothetical protein
MCNVFVESVEIQERGKNKEKKKEIRKVISFSERDAKDSNSRSSQELPSQAQPQP